MVTSISLSRYMIWMELHVANVYWYVYWCSCDYELCIYFDLNTTDLWYVQSLTPLTKCCTNQFICTKQCRAQSIYVQCPHALSVMQHDYNINWDTDVLRRPPPPRHHLRSVQWDSTSPLNYISPSPEAPRGLLAFVSVLSVRRMTYVWGRKGWWHSTEY